MIFPPTLQVQDPIVSDVHHAGARTTMTRWTSWTIDAAILGLATLCTAVALQLDRPRTAVLVYLLGVLFIGSRSGLYRGIVAALAASFVYNFLLSEPVFRLGASSVDEIVPLLAFNISAVVSGGLAGRLNDRANAARQAEAKNAVMLELSDQLQRAIALEDVVAIARRSLVAVGVTDLVIELNVDPPAKDGGERLPLSLQSRSGPEHPEVGNQRSELRQLHGTNAAGSVRFVLVAQEVREVGLPDLQAITNLLSLAIDRCALLDKLSESRAVQRSEELKSALLSSLSHDLRTPLTAIEAASTSLLTLRPTLDPRQEEEMLETINEQCAKLNRYTANLLDMGRIQTGISDSQLENVDMVEILGVALGAARKRFPDQEICKEVAVTSALVRSNGPMLEQAIFNLLENAVVHGGAGKPIQVRLTLDAAASYLEVTDNGPGIPPSQQPQLFERFYRGRDGTHGDGHGLGLHIAKGFVEAFGGSIALQSPVIENLGTTITVRLPLLPRQPETEGPLDAYSAC